MHWVDSCSMVVHPAVHVHKAPANMSVHKGISSLLYTKSVPGFQHRNYSLYKILTFRQQYCCLHQSENSTTEVEEKYKGHITQNSCTMKGQTWFYMPFVFFLNLSCTVHSDEGSICQDFCIIISVWESWDRFSVHIPSNLASWRGYIQLWWTLLASSLVLLKLILAFCPKFAKFTNSYPHRSFPLYGIVVQCYILCVCAL